MRFSTLIACTAIAALCAGVPFIASGPTEPTSGHEEDHEVELAPYMARLQRFSEKLGFAIHAQNQPLAGFYLHEIEEIAEELEREVPVHDGHAIASMSKTIFHPAISRLEEALGSGTWPERRRDYESLVQSCNGCHTAAGHDFIHILPAEGEGTDRYNQDFTYRPAATPK